MADASPPSAGYQAAEDVAQVASVDRDMELIDAKFNSQGMLAFGANTERLKAAFGELRKTQMDIFLTHMNLEMDFSRDPEGSGGGGGGGGGGGSAGAGSAAAADGDGQRGRAFQAKFQEKEEKVVAISRMLDELGEQMLDMNEQVLQGAAASASVGRAAAGGAAEGAAKAADGGGAAE